MARSRAFEAFHTLNRKGPHTLQYGLIAEEVAKVYPELVANDHDGQPYTVCYQYFAAMLVNEGQETASAAPRLSPTLSSGRNRGLTNWSSAWCRWKHCTGFQSFSLGHYRLEVSANTRM